MLVVIGFCAVLLCFVPRGHHTISAHIATLATMRTVNIVQSIPF